MNITEIANNTNNKTSSTANAWLDIPRDAHELKLGV